MLNVNEFVLRGLSMLVFTWLFERTRQLYITSLSKPAVGGTSSFNPPNSRGFVQETLLGRRSIPPFSFFLRALIFLIIVIIILPYKDYDFSLYWFVIILIGFYVFWSCALGML